MVFALSSSHVKKPVVFHLVTGMEIGGCEKALSRLLPHLQSHTPHLINLGKPSALCQALEQAGVPVHSLNAKGLFDRKAIRQFKDLIQTHHPQLLVTYLLHADVFGRLWGKRLGIPRLIKSIRARLPEWRYVFFWIFELLTSFRVDHYVAVAPSSRDFYARTFRIPSRKFTVIPNAADLKELTPLPLAARLSLRTSLHLAASDFVLTYVSKLRITQKNHRFLIHVFSLFQQRFPGAKLLLVGDGPDRVPLQHFIESQGLSTSIQLLGDRNDVPALLQITDVFVFPSLYEGMSNALIEALCSGCSIVASDIPENRDVISNEEAWLCDPRDPSAWVHALTEARDPALCAPRLQAAQRRAAYFRLDQVAQQWDTFYLQQLSLIHG